MGGDRLNFCADGVVVGYCRRRRPHTHAVGFHRPDPPNGASYFDDVIANGLEVISCRNVCERWRDVLIRVEEVCFTVMSLYGCGGFGWKLDESWLGTAWAGKKRVVQVDIGRRLIYTVNLQGVRGIVLENV